MSRTGLFSHAQQEAKAQEIYERYVRGSIAGVDDDFMRSMERAAGVHQRHLGIFRRFIQLCYRRNKSFRRADSRTIEAILKVSAEYPE